MVVLAPPYLDRSARAGVPARKRRDPILTSAAWAVLGGFAIAGYLGAGNAIVMWGLLVVLISAHEAGHAFAGHRLGLPIVEVVIGLGPILARFSWSGVPIEIRSFPIVGWVESDIPFRAPRIHRRRVAFAAAGPAASLCLAVILVLVAYAMAWGPSSISVGDVLGASRLSVEMAVETPVALASSMWAFAESGASHDDGSGDRAAPHAGEESSEDSEPVTIIGATRAMSDDIDHYGRVAMPLWAATLSAAIAGFNLIPAFGLDGEMILSAAADGVRSRHRKAGRALRATVALLGLALGGVVLIAVLRALVSDIGGLV